MAKNSSKDMFNLVSLRREVDAMEKYDIAAFPEMRGPYKQRKNELFALKSAYNRDTPFKDCPLDYLIYHRLIHGERNIVVHEVQHAYSDPWTYFGPDGRFDLDDIYLPMGDVDLWGDWDCRDWLKEGIGWWRKDIASMLKEVFVDE